MIRIEHMGRLRSEPSIWLLGILVVFMASRLATLMSVPIFIDEAIHLQWAKEAADGDLTVGGGHWKWLAVQTFGLLFRCCDASLVSARLLSVILGLAIVMVLYAVGQTGRKQDGQISGLASALLYTLVPFSVFYDRLALTDGFLTFLLALIFFFTFRILGKPSHLDQVLLGAVLFLSPMFKGNGLFFFPIPIVISMVVSARGERLPQLRKFLLPYALAVPVGGLFLLSALRLAVPASDMAAVSVFQPIDAWLKAVSEAMLGSFGVMWSMLSPPLFLGLAVGCTALLLLFPDQTSRRRCVAGIAVTVLLVMPHILVFQSLFPRYYLPLLVPICLVGGEVWLFVVSVARTQNRAFERLLTRLPLVIVIVLVSIQSVRLSVSPLGFPFPAEIRRQFFIGWPSGYGLQAAIEEIHHLSRRHSQGLNILRTPGWDIPLQGLDAYANDLGLNVKRITLQSRNLKLAAVQVSGALDGGNATYMLFDSAYPYPGDRELVESIRAGFEVEEIAHFVRPDNHPGLKLWHIQRKPEPQLVSS